MYVAMVAFTILILREYKSDQEGPAGPSEFVRIGHQARRNKEKESKTSTQSSDCTLFGHMLEDIRFVFLETGEINKVVLGTPPRPSCQPDEDKQEHGVAQAMPCFS